MIEDFELVKSLYERFNKRDMAEVIAALHSDVVWANGMEGGHVFGHDGVRNYWTRQWALIDPHVVPVRFAGGADGDIVVDVQQTVRDLQGKLLSEKMVGHVFQVENGLIRRFDIRDP
jgi:ketosteroid isomerase-like protein